MQRIDSLLRWLGAIGITLGPLGLIVLPTLFYPGYDTVEEQFRATAEGADAYAPALQQVFGSAFFLLAAVGIGGLTIARGRGRTFGTIGLVIGLVGAASALVTMGFELCQILILVTASDPDVAVALALAVNESLMFSIFLWVAIVSALLTMPILGLALWRSKVVPIIVPLLFLLLPLVGFLPPSVAADIASVVVILVPCVWMAVQLIRGTSKVSSITDYRDSVDL